MCEIYTKLTIKTLKQRQWRLSGVSLLTLNTFHTFFLYFYCWLWTSKSKLGSALFVKFEDNFPSNHLLVQNIIRNIRNRCETYSKLSIKTPQRSFWHRSVFIVDFQHISHLFSISAGDSEQVNVCCVVKHKAMKVRTLHTQFSNKMCSKLKKKIGILKNKELNSMELLVQNDLIETWKF